MKSSFAKIGRSGVLAYMLVIGWTEASALERAELSGGTSYRDGNVTLEGLTTEEMEKRLTEYRRIVHVAGTLNSPKDALRARGLYHEVLRSEREAKNKSAEQPDWLERMIQDYNPVETREKMRKMLSTLGELVPGPGVFQAFGMDKEILKESDRLIWRSGCGGSPDCLMWTAAKFVMLEQEGKETALMRKLTTDLGVLPTNSTWEAYGEPSAWEERHGFRASKYIFEPGSREEKRVSEAQGDENLAKMAEKNLGQKLSREGLEERIAEWSTGQREETQGGPLQEYQRRMEARIEREIRVDIYRSLGTFASFADPELGRVIATGFPAVERLVDGLSEMLSGTVTLAAFGDVLGSAAALTNLVSSLAGSEDALARNIQMIQRGLKTISDQVRSVDRKVELVMKRLDEVAAMTASTNAEVHELRRRMEEIHGETIRQFGSQSGDIRGIAKFMIEVEKLKMLERITEVESCVTVNEQTLLPVDEHVRCRLDALNLAENLAGQRLYTDLTMQSDLVTFFGTDSESPRRYDAGDAHWLAGHWRKAAETVVNAKVEALENPTRYRRLFEMGETEAQRLRVAARELSAMRDESAINPLIWHKGIELYVKLERQRGPDVLSDDKMTRRLIDSAGQMKNLLKVIEDGNLASDAMELHLLNGHLLVQVLRELWSEYLNTKRYRFTTCTEKELEDPRRGVCEAEFGYGWKGNDDLVFEYWLNDYDGSTKYLPTDDPVKLQAMVRLLRANDGKNGVESKVVEIERPQINFDQDIEVLSEERNQLAQPGFWSEFWSEEVVFPAIYGDVGVSWTGCLKVGVEHRIQTHRTFGTEVKWICVGDKPNAPGPAVRQFVEGGHLKRRFRRPRGSPTWCYLDGEASFLRDATYDGRPMVANWTLDGFAYIREGSLVLNQIGLTRGWDEPDKWYSNRVIKRDAFRLARYEAEGRHQRGFEGEMVMKDGRSCEFQVLWGTKIKDGGFFPDTLYVDEIYYVRDPVIEGHFTREERREVMTREGVKDDEAYREHKGAMLLFNPTDRNIAFLKGDLARIIFHQEVEKIFDTLKWDMVGLMSNTTLSWHYLGDAVERQTVKVDVAEYEFAARQTMARFIEWATDDNNMRREVELDWAEGISWAKGVFGFGAGFVAPIVQTSLEEALRRLDESWRAVQVLSRVVAGTCAATPGGTSFEVLARELASGEDVEDFLKHEATYGNRFQSWAELRKYGLLGVSSAGLVEDAAQLKERVGALDKWPLQTELRLARYREGAILLASLDAAMEVAREAARRSGVVVVSENDAQGHELEAVLKHGPAVATLSRQELKTKLLEHEIAIISKGTHDIEIFRNVGPVRGSSDAAGIPITWLHAEEEVSAFDIVVREVSMNPYGPLEPEQVSKLENHAIENILQHVQSMIGDVLGGRTCRPGIDEFDDGTKQLESINVH